MAQQYDFSDIFDEADEAEGAATKSIRESASSIKSTLAELKFGKPKEVAANLSLAAGALDAIEENGAAGLVAYANQFRAREGGNRPQQDRRPETQSAQLIQGLEAEVAAQRAADPAPQTPATIAVTPTPTSGARVRTPRGPTRREAVNVVPLTGRGHGRGRATG